MNIRRLMVSRWALALGAGLFATVLGSTGSALASEGMTGSMSGMSKSAMSHMSTTHSMAMGGMSMTVANHTTNILPSWLSVLWMLVFIVIIVIHGRHVVQSSGQSRVWHSGHVFMALGMAVMYAPTSVDSFNVPTGFWSLAFADGAIAIVLWMLYEAFTGRGTNLLWLAMAFDLGAMAYMWSPSGFQAPISWLLVAYFAGQSLLWGTNRMRNLDQRTILGGRLTVTAGGAVAATAVEPLICERDLRVSMAAMTLGMAYMFAAMQLVM